MKYVIYVLSQPHLLKEIDDSGYNPTYKYKTVLEKLSVSNVEDEHPTMESATAEILSKSQMLRHLTLTIIPVFEINYEGDVR